jgi:hypothetical protein
MPGQKFDRWNEQRDCYRQLWCVGRYRRRIWKRRNKRQRHWCVRRKHPRRRRIRQEPRALYCRWFANLVGQNFCFVMGRLYIRVALSIKGAAEPPCRDSRSEISNQGNYSVSSADHVLLETVAGLSRILSGTATKEEIELLRKLRFNGKRPTSLYYYRELQSLRDPLHFRPSDSR